jgi:hypothetical protein
MESGVVTNSALYNCLHILKHKYSMRPSLAGFGSFGVDELYFKLRRYRERNRGSGGVPGCASSEACPSTTALIGPALPSGGSMRDISVEESQVTKHTAAAAAHTDACRPQPPVKYYVAALDLEKCYDNVDTSLLFDLVVNLLCAEEERVQGCADNRDGPTITADANGCSGNRASAGSKAKESNHDCGPDDNGEVDDRDDGYLVHRYSVAHYISRYGTTTGRSCLQFPPSNTAPHCADNSLNSLPIISNNASHVATHSMERVVTKPVRFVAGAGDLTPFRGIDLGTRV